MLGDTVEDGEDFGEGCDGDEGDAELLEVEEATKVGSIVFAHLEDCLALAFEVDSGKEVFAAYGHAVGDSRHSGFAA